MTHFKMPEPGAPLAAFEDAARQLNAIEMTQDQVWRGYQVHTRAESGKLAALIAWAKNEGLTPADAAAHAIVVRSYGVMETLNDAGAFEEDMPKASMALLTGPIYPADLGWFEALRPPATAAEAA